jgi:chromate reductase
MSAIKVAVIVGSNRRESLNRKLARALMKLGDGDRLQFTLVQIDDMPIYNADLEGSRPASVDRFTAEVAAAQAILVVTPEHNRSITTLLKNAIDWGSKPSDRNVWRNKPAAITGASPGNIATAPAQQHLRQILGNLGAIILGGEVYVSFKPGLVDDAFEVTVPETRTFLENFLDRFADMAEKLTS